MLRLPQRRYRLVKIDTDAIDSQLVGVLLASIERHALAVDWLLAEAMSLEQVIRMQQLGYSRFSRPRARCA